MEQLKAYSTDSGHWLNVMKKYWLFFAMLLVGWIPSLYGANHTGLVTCTRIFSDVDGECKIAVSKLEDKQNVNSTFAINYHMTCDPGGSPNQPSTLRIITDTEGGNQSQTIVNYKTDASYKIDGYGPIKLTDVDPVGFASLNFNGSCELRVNVSITKSARTIQEETDFLNKIDQFLSGSRTELNDTFKLMVQYKADVFSEQKNKAALACTINKYMTDALYDDIIADLKADYLLSFGESFTPSACISGVNLALANDCASNDLSRVCTYKMAYFKGRDRILETKRVAEAYLQDSNTTSFHDRLKNIIKVIDEWEN